jgi:hypothetical protein
MVAKRIRDLAHRVVGGRHVSPPSFAWAQEQYFQRRLGSM